MTRPATTARSRRALLVGPKNPRGLYYRAGTEALKRLGAACHLDLLNRWSEEDGPLDLLLGTSPGSFIRAARAIESTCAERIFLAFAHGGFLAGGERAQAKHRRAYELASSVICQTSAQARIVRQEYPQLSTLKICPLILPCDLRADLTPQEQALAQRALWLDSEHPIYLVIIDWEDTHQIETALSLSRLHPDWQFILFGDNPKARRRALSFQRELPLENVRAMSELRIELVGSLLCASQALIILDSNLACPFLLEDAIASHLPIASVRLPLLAGLLDPAKDYLEIPQEASRIARALTDNELSRAAESALAHMAQLQRDFDPTHYLG